MLEINGEKNKGFTLIELLVAMVISTLVASAIFYAYQGQQNAQLAQKQIVDMQQTIRAAKYIMTKEIRMAGYDPDGMAGAGINTAGDGSDGNPLGFTFVANGDGVDNDNDATIDELRELKTIEYDLYDADSDGDLDIGRKVGTASREVIAENISVLAFAYLDLNGSVTANISDIRTVQITIEATIDSSQIRQKNVNNRTLTTMIQCRNLYY
jgi:type IV pilus assembly protein PilW